MHAIRTDRVAGCAQVDGFIGEGRAEIGDRAQNSSGAVTEQRDRCDVLVHIRRQGVSEAERRCGPRDHDISRRGTQRIAARRNQPAGGSARPLPHP